MEALFKRVLQIIVYTSIAAVTAGLSGTAAARNLKPLIPLPATSRTLPLVSEALRDPSIFRHAVSDDYGIEQLDLEIQENLSDLKNKAKGLRREEIFSALTKAYAKKMYFYQEVLVGRQVSMLPQTKIAAELKKAERDLILAATQLAKFTKNKRVKAQAVYLALATKYDQGRKGEAVKGFRKIVKTLPKSLANRANLVLALHDINYGKRAEAERTLARLAKALPTEGKVVSLLTLARVQAGLNARHQKVGKTRAAYKQTLKSATRTAQHLTKVQREAVLRFSLSLWRAAEGKHDNKWHQMPLYTRAFQDSPSMKAIIERIALSELAKGQTAKAIRKYRALANSHEGTSLMVAIDRRILDIEFAEFRKTKKISAYEKALAGMANKYRATDLFNAGDRNLAAKAQDEFMGRYRSFVHTMLAAAKKRSAKAALRKDAVRLGLNYRQFVLDDARELKGVNLALAQVYAADGRHAAAVSLYRDLIAQSQGEEARTYLNAAIRSQRILAGWPVAAPWTGVKRGNANERASLAEFYGKLNEMNGSKIDWNILAHLGLLQVQLGQAEQAFALWQGALDKASHGADAAQAAGFMLSSYSSAKRWRDLEKLADLCISKKIRPRLGKKNLDARTFLADALYFGGKEAYAAGNFEEAVRSLGRFTATFKAEPRRDEAMYVLALAYHGNKQYPEAVKTLLTHVEQYPQSKFNRPALLNGIAWSLPMAYEEQALYFINQFLGRYPKDAKTPEIRMTAVPLYMGRELYGHATRVYKQHSLDSRVSREEQLTAALRYLEIEERFGDVNKARWGAERVRKIGGGNQVAMAQVLGFEARHFAKNDLRALQTIEKQLTSYSSDESAVRENLGLVRFMMAEKKALKTHEEIFNLGVKDPLGTINRHYAYFVQSKKDYDSVCGGGDNTYCAPAMMRLARITENTIRTIEDLTIAETLDAGEVVKFNERKQAVMGALADTAVVADSQSMAMIQDGVTTAVWTEEIVWTNSTDWNFDQTSGETGNSYIQWNAAAQVAE